ncbi:MAG: L,D-transpeptidase [Bauldia sp.]|nr:L,D-transpeptidase [Bauldia sp.]
MQLEQGPLGNLGNGSGSGGSSNRTSGGGGLNLNLNLTPGGSFYPEQVNPSRVPGRQFKRQVVNFKTDEKAGTIVINSRAHYLYYVLGDGKAVRYGIGVGREGFGWQGTVSVGRKAEWPTWTPPPEMIAREKARGRILPASMDGGPKNPLGARALYLYRNGNDTMYRIHGTSEPWTIGLNVSSGCIRMVNNDVIDLYNRAKVGTKVVVL